MRYSLLALPLILFMTGCQTMSQTPTYSVVIVNGTTNTIDNAHVRFGQFESIGGYLRPGIKKTHSFVPIPPPEKALVVWTSQDGKSHEETVEVLKILPKDFNDEDIIFTIQEDGNVAVTNKPTFHLPK
jgi:hypothetical protein